MEDAVRHGHVTVQKILREHGAQLSELNMGVKMCEAAAEADGETLQVTYNIHITYTHIYICTYR
jgi:hypothetical protein